MLSRKEEEREISGNDLFTSLSAMLPLGIKRVEEAYRMLQKGAE